MGRDDLRSRLRRYTWHEVAVGRSAASVHRLSGVEELYLKQARGPAAPELMAEAERTDWLYGAGLPAARVLDTGHDEEGAWLLTAALPGRSLAQIWPPALLPAVAQSVARALRALHALTGCPFRRDLAAVVPHAMANAEAGRVDTDDFDAGRRGWSLEQLTTALDASVPGDEDLVVAHGDFCAPNILLDPDTLEVTGLVDLGRLGVADRHQDLALFERSVSDLHLNPHLGPGLARDFLTAYGGQMDPDRVAFYRLLDEFF